MTLSTDPVIPMASSGDAGSSAGDTAGQAGKYAQVVEEEIPIQTANLPVNGGLPSCVTLMDNFLLCFSVRNQFTSLYRYGTARECAPKWEDFKFCMANRSLSEERKEEEWIRRRAEHWAERRVGPSSEDIWEAKKLH